MLYLEDNPNDCILVPATNLKNIHAFSWYFTDKIGDEVEAFNNVSFIKVIKKALPKNTNIHHLQLIIDFAAQALKHTIKPNTIDAKVQNNLLKINKKFVSQDGTLSLLDYEAIYAADQYIHGGEPKIQKYHYLESLEADKVPLSLLRKWINETTNIVLREWFEEIYNLHVSLLYKVEKPPTTPRFEMSTFNDTQYMFRMFNQSPQIAGEIVDQLLRPSLSYTDTSTTHKILKRYTHGSKICRTSSGDIKFADKEVALSIGFTGTPSMEREIGAYDFITTVLPLCENFKYVSFGWFAFMDVFIRGVWEECNTNERIQLSISDSDFNILMYLLAELIKIHGKKFDNGIFVKFRYYKYLSLSRLLGCYYILLNLKERSSRNYDLIEDHPLKATFGTYIKSLNEPELIDFVHCWDKHNIDVLTHFTRKVNNFGTLNLARRFEDSKDDSEYVNLKPLIEKKLTFHYSVLHGILDGCVSEKLYYKLGSAIFSGITTRTY